MPIVDPRGLIDRGLIIIIMMILIMIIKVHPRGLVDRRRGQACDLD